MKGYISKIILIGLIIFILSFATIEILILIEGNRIDNEEVDYLIVLGARLYGKTPSQSLLERLKSANRYLEENEGTKVVVSGGQGADETISEAYVMSQYLVSKGISKDRIIIEDKSKNTFENLKFSLDKIRTDGGDETKVMIATSKYHIFRSKMIAKRLGMEPYGLPANFPPTSAISSYIREYFAVIKSFLFDRP